MKQFVRFLPWAAVCVLCTQAVAAVINVPADFPTIQQAVNAAGFSDTVLVAPGVYQENVMVTGKSIMLASHYLLDGNPAHVLNTVIDASQPTHPDSGSAVILYNGNAVLCGFTLTGGTGTRWLDLSDGNFFREGGGVLTDGGSPTIRDNVVIGNRATDKSTSTSAGGGGMRSGFCLTVNVVHNVFAYNEGLYGGGVVIFRNPASFRNNIVYRNSGGQDFGGGGVWFASVAGTSTFANNDYIDNHSTTDGGGLLIWNATANVYNSIARDNTAITGPQIRLRTGAAASTVTYSDVAGGFVGTGNIDSDPLFNGSLFTLQGASPCIDTGDPAPARNDPEDTGNPGMALAPSLGTVHSDMGAAGGPDAAPFPDFNSPQAYLAPDTINFDTVRVDSARVRTVVIGKLQFGIIQVDSVRFAGDASLSALSVPDVLGPLGSGPVDSFSVLWEPVTYGPLAATLQVYHGDVSSPNPLTVVVRGHAPGKTGDTNFDGVITSADIIHLVNYVFKGGLPPRPVPRSGDVDCSGTITSADIIGLVNYVFKGGIAPCA